MAERKARGSWLAKRAQFGHDENGPTFSNFSLFVVLYDSSAAETGHARYRFRYIFIFSKKNAKLTYFLILGSWEPGDENRAAGYEGPIFGPTSLVINNECNGEDPTTPGGPGESRRIKAFKWFSEYFGLPIEEDHLLTCKGMPRKLDQLRTAVSYQPDWGSTWKGQSSCDCAPASYGGMIPYFEERFYPAQFVEQNNRNRRRCVQSIYSNPKMYSMTNDTNRCLDYPPPEMLG